MNKTEPELPRYRQGNRKFDKQSAQHNCTCTQIKIESGNNRKLIK